MSQLSQCDVLFFKEEVDYMLSTDVEVRNMVNLIQQPSNEPPMDLLDGNYQIHDNYEASALDQVAVDDFPVAVAPPLISNNVICNDEYEGPYQFEITITPNGKNHWLYSSHLKKMFIDMSSNFLVGFKITAKPEFDLYVRVTPVFSMAQYSQEMVHRCINHEAPSDPTNRDISDHVRQHIIRCHNQSAIYWGDKRKNQRLSVVIPLGEPQTGSDLVREMFSFVCKNSCVTGMNRRPIELIFTLETAHGEILGRRVMNVRICSCPKRDKEKEEKEAGFVELPPLGKKRKMESKRSSSSENGKIEKKRPPLSTSEAPVDTNKYQVTMEVVGLNNANLLAKYSHDLMAGEMTRYANTSAGMIFKRCCESHHNKTKIEKL